MRKPNIDWCHANAGIKDDPLAAAFKASFIKDGFDFAKLKKGIAACGCKVVTDTAELDKLGVKTDYKVLKCLVVTDPDGVIVAAGQSQSPDLDDLLAHALKGYLIERHQGKRGPAGK